MSELINDMLNLSRLSRGSLRWETVKLSQVAQEVADVLKREEPDRNVVIDIQPEMSVFGDTNLLRALLENLIGNSWKFTSKHDTALIQFFSIQQDNQTVYCVKDDGAGFEMEYAENLFGAFQRLHDMTEFEGTGIGLATVQRIVHRHGGKVWAVGEVEKGAQVFFSLGDRNDSGS
jgi:light-regulated signal transduction histidine kinase (bacteriophytochrome)